MATVPGEIIPTGRIKTMKRLIACAVLLGVMVPVATGVVDSPEFVFHCPQDDQCDQEIRVAFDSEWDVETAACGEMEPGEDRMYSQCFNPVNQGVEDSWINVSGYHWEVQREMSVPVTYTDEVFPDEGRVLGRHPQLMHFYPSSVYDPDDLAYSTACWETKVAPGSVYHSVSWEPRTDSVRCTAIAGPGWGTVIDIGRALAVAGVLLIVLSTVLYWGRRGTRSEAAE